MYPRSTTFSYKLMPFQVSFFQFPTSQLFGLRFSGEKLMSKCSQRKVAKKFRNQDKETKPAVMSCGPPLVLSNEAGHPCSTLCCHCLRPLSVLCAFELQSLTEVLWKSAQMLAGAWYGIKMWTPNDAIKRKLGGYWRSAAIVHWHYSLWSVLPGRRTDFSWWAFCFLWWLCLWFITSRILSLDLYFTKYLLDVLAPNGFWSWFCWIRVFIPYFHIKSGIVSVSYLCCWPLN